MNIIKDVKATPLSMKCIKYTGKCIIIILGLCAALTACDSQEIPITPAVPRPDIPVREMSAENLTEAPVVLEEAAKENNAAAPSFNVYNVTMEINPATRKVAAIEKISYKNRTGTELDRIYLKNNINAFAQDYEPPPYFSINKAKIYKYGNSYTEFKINSITINSENVEYVSSGTNIEIVLPKKLMPEDNIDITMQFECTIPKICHRTGANDDAMWFGNFIPLVAVFQNGEFILDGYYPAGDPFVTEASNFDVKITTPKEYTVVGTGLETVVENETNKTTSMSVNMHRDFAFAISNKFKSMKISTPSGIAVNFHYFSDNIAKMALLTEVVVNSVEYFNKKVGAYPYQEIEIVETELFLQGGIELPGVIFMDKAYLQNSLDFESVAHEIGHQWFYNIVGSNQIAEPWMDEGLTTYLQKYIFAEPNKVNAQMEELYQQLQKDLTRQTEYALGDDLSVYTTWSDYYNVNYLRGALMFHALYLKLGEAGFYEFTGKYFAENSFKLATKESMIRIASEINGDSLDDFFTSWMTWKVLPNLPATKLTNIEEGKTG